MLEFHPTSLSSLLFSYPSPSRVTLHFGKSAVLQHLACICLLQTSLRVALLLIGVFHVCKLLARGNFAD